MRWCPIVLWLDDSKFLLKASSIDTSNISAHSVETASSSAGASGGISTSYILKVSKGFTTYEQMALYLVEWCSTNTQTTT